MKISRPSLEWRSYIIRISAAALFLGLLYYFGLLNFGVLARLYRRPELVAVAAALLLATIPLGALRWHLLLRCQGFMLPFRKTLEVVLVGQFFNTFLPGAYGGDLVRAGYIYHGARRQAGNLLSSILVDRLSGLAGLIILGIVAQFALPTIIDIRIIATMSVIAIGMGSAFILLPTLGRFAATFAQWLSLSLRDRLLRLSSQTGSAIKVYLRRPGVLALALVISTAQFALSLAALVVLASAFDFVTVSFSTIAFAGITSLVANSVPVTPGGIGVGEAAFAKAVTLIDPTATGPYATIFLASRALTLLLGLLGGLVFMQYRNEIIEYVEEGHSHPKDI